MRLAGIASLAKLTSEHERRFGTKAVNLGRLLNWGLPVPAGFALAFAGEGPLVLDDGEQSAIRRAYAGAPSAAGGGAQNGGG